jgi:BolA protein
MSVQQTITDKLRDALAPDYLDVLNESHMHNVPAGSESHFKVVAVAECFEGKPLIQRHRLINAALAEELAGKIHALALHTMTPAEWAARGERVADSPECRGGSKA